MDLPLTTELVCGRPTVIITSKRSEENVKNSPPKECSNIAKKIFQSQEGSTIENIRTLRESINKNNADKDKKLQTEKPIHRKQFMGSLCPYCDFRPVRRTVTPYQLKAHMRTHTGEKPFECTVCDFSTANKFYLDTHMKKHTGERPFKCDACSYSTTRKDSLKRHMSKHSNEKEFECPECNFRCASKQGLRQHWSFHCKFEHFSCSVCVYRCRGSADLKTHMLTHPALMSCTKCDYMGRCVEDLEKHDSVFHKIVKKIRKKVVTVRKEQEKFSCSKCGVIMTTKGALKRHILYNRCKV